MIDLKTILGASALIAGFVGYALYSKDIFKGRTKPHFFSWFIWALLLGVIFIVQVIGKAGPGAWVTGFSSVIAMAVAMLALKKGEKEITRLDWLCFVGALVGIILWITTNNPLLAVILVTLVDAVAFIPTFRKSYGKPYEETVLEYVFAALKWVISLFAIESFRLVVWLYPASLVLTNGLFVLMVLVRRRLIK